MGRPYSLELRERVVDAAAASSRRQAAIRFGAGTATAIRWMAALAQTGTVAARQQGCPCRSKLDPHEAFLRAPIVERDDITLKEMRVRLSAAAGETATVLHVVHTIGGHGLATPIRTGWEGCLEDAGLDAAVIPHTLRHTAATWLMRAGVEPWKAASLLGMSLETLQSVCGHHHPDFQDGAAGAFGGIG